MGQQSERMWKALGRKRLPDEAQPLLERTRSDVETGQIPDESD
jgi:hypothetical protein